MLRGRRFWTAGILALAAGCSGHSNQNQATFPGGEAGVGTQTAQAPAADSSAPANSDDAAALAQHTAKYAQDMAALMAHNAARPGAATQPSVVQWIDPGPAHNTAPAATANTDQAIPTAPATRASGPVAADSGDRGAIPAAARMNPDSDMPVILPESADRLPDPAATAVAAPAATDSTDEYEKKLAQRVHDDPHDLTNQMDYQILRLVRDEPSPDMETLSGLSAEDREVVSALVDGIGNLRNASRADPNLLLSKKIAPLVEMADRLRSQSELAIPTVALCTRVDSFGVYKPLTSTRLPAGKETEVIVYSEVANFTSVQNDDKMWETKLTQGMVIYSEAGLEVWPEKSNAEHFVDSARNRRHDFFIPRKVKLPATLSIGRYLLKVTLTDEQSNRVAEATTPFEIVAE